VKSSNMVTPFAKLWATVRQTVLVIACVVAPVAAQQVPIQPIEEVPPNAPTPEPVTVSLLAAGGVAGIGLLAWRRRRQSARQTS
jgi:hypothetical protein